LFDHLPDLTGTGHGTGAGTGTGTGTDTSILITVAVVYLQGYSAASQLATYSLREYG
jgi:hypothetical protein